jgi:hypothetical protein
MKSGIILLSMLLAISGFVGCDDDDWDHKPPSGQGSLIVDNRTVDDIEVYVNGEFQGKVDGGDDLIVDLAPGLYRVVLNEEDDLRSFRDDVDVLEGRLSILEVDFDSFADVSYTVYLFFD